MFHHYRSHVSGPHHSQYLVAQHEILNENRFKLETINEERSEPNKTINKAVN